MTPDVKNSNQQPNNSAELTSSQANPSETVVVVPSSGSTATEHQIPPGHARPVMIHRAIVGSFERFIAILTEQFAGKWPLWLSPRQILVIPVMVSASSYVLEVQKIFKEHEFYVDVDLGGNTMNKKVRSGQLLGYNFILGES
jgi:threonyl-tRNA synthetase